MIDWKPIDTAPTDGTRVMLWMVPREQTHVPVIEPEAHACFGAFVRWPERERAAGYKDGWSWFGGAGYQPTHWAEAPEGPIDVQPVENGELARAMRELAAGSGI